MNLWIIVQTAMVIAEKSVDLKLDLQALPPPPIPSLIYNLYFYIILIFLFVSIYKHTVSHWYLVFFCLFIIILFISDLYVWLIEVILLVCCCSIPISYSFTVFHSDLYACLIEVIVSLLLFYSYKL